MQGEKKMSTCKHCGAAIARRAIDDHWYDGVSLFCEHNLADGSDASVPRGMQLQHEPFVSADAPSKRDAVTSYDLQTFDEWARESNLHDNERHVALSAWNAAVESARVLALKTQMVVILGASSNCSIDRVNAATAADIETLRTRV